VHVRQSAAADAWPLIVNPRMACVGGGQRAHAPAVELEGAVCDVVGRAFHHQLPPGEAAQGHDERARLPRARAGVGVRSKLCVAVEDDGGAPLSVRHHLAPAPAPCSRHQPQRIFVRHGGAAGWARCVSIFLDKNRRYIGKSQSKRPPKRSRRRSRVGSRARWGAQAARATRQTAGAGRHRRLRRQAAGSASSLDAPVPDTLAAAAVPMAPDSPAADAAPCHWAWPPT
jgi:hypothetical protein